MPRPRLHPFVRLIIFCGGAFLSMLIAGGVVLAGSMLMSARATDGDTAAMMIGMTLLSYPLVLLWMWFCRQVLDSRSFVSLGLRRATADRDCINGLLCGTAAIAFLFGVLLLTGFVQLGASTGHVWSQDVLDSGAPAIAGQLLIWAAVFVAVGVVEELVFRGYLFHNLSAWMGTSAAILVQAVVFALVHVPNVVGADTGAPEAALQDAFRALPNLILIAVFFSLCYLKTGSLWFPIGFHIAWNFCLGCIFSLPVSGLPVTHLLDVKVSGNPLVTGGVFGPEGSILLLPILAVMNYLLLRQPNHPQADLDLALLRPPEPVAEAQEPDEPHTPRFKTSMKSRSETLEPEIVDTLRQLSEAKAARRQEAMYVAHSDVVPAPEAAHVTSSQPSKLLPPNTLQHEQRLASATMEPSLQSDNSSWSTPTAVPTEHNPEAVTTPRAPTTPPATESVPVITEDAPPKPDVPPRPVEPARPAQTKKPPGPRW